jgi:hypothetical protein
MNKTSCKTSNKKKPQIHISISDKGEICAWGLAQNQEEKLFNLTGNHKLSETCPAMSFKLCG